MWVHCMLRSVLHQSPITLNSKQPTHHGASLRAEVSAATGPLPTELRLNCNGAPLHAEVSAATGPHHPVFKHKPTLHGSPLHTEVIAAAGPHHAKLKTTDT